MIEEKVFWDLIESQKILIPWYSVLEKRKLEDFGILEEAQKENVLDLDDFATIPLEADQNSENEDEPISEKLLFNRSLQAPFYDSSFFGIDIKKLLFSEKIKPKESSFSPDIANNLVDNQDVESCEESMSKLQLDGNYVIYWLYGNRIGTQIGSNGNTKEKIRFIFAEFQDQTIEEKK